MCAFGFKSLPSGARGFTLVEIMITVVIIGLLAAMAVPGFKLVRSRTYTFLMRNDARQLAGAAQQYITEYNENLTVGMSANTQNGVVQGALSVYVKSITRGTVVGDYDSTMVNSGPAFTMSNLYVEDGAPQSFDNIGKLLSP